jgi:hypothetical protein
MQGVSLRHFHIYLKYILAGSSPPSFSPPFPYRFHCSIFTQVYKVHWPYSCSFIPPPPLSSILALTGPVLHSCPSFPKCIFVLQRGFAVTVRLWVYCTLIRFTTALLSLSKILPSDLKAYIGWKWRDGKRYSTQTLPKQSSISAF